MLGHVVHCKTSAEIWNVFDQLFSTRSKARILQLRFSLQTTQKGADFMEEDILKMKVDDAFFNRNWAGACWGRWAGPRLLVGWAAGSWIIWVEVGSL